MVWDPTALVLGQPVDALSRLSGTDPTSITQATIDAVSKWGSLMSNIRQLTHMGSARV